MSDLASMKKTTDSYMSLPTNNSWGNYILYIFFLSYINLIKIS